jgi:hypothetical protein
VSLLRASELRSSERLLGVPVPLADLFPAGGLRRGTVVVVAGSTSLLLQLAATALPSGGWCAAVGFPALGLAAAIELGVDPHRFVTVRVPDQQWTTAVAALLDGLDVLLVNPPAQSKPGEGRRLAARARERGTVVLATRWPDATELQLSVAGTSWQGLGEGWGRLRDRRLQVTASGRGAAARQRQASLWLRSAS